MVPQAAGVDGKIFILLTYWSAISVASITEAG